MGGKDDAPDSPDYSELAAASSESAKYSYELAKQQFDWAKQVYAENKGTGDLVIEAALNMLDTQMEWAAEDRQRYEDIFQPLEEQLAKEAEDYASPERQEVEAGKAEADVAQQFQQARQAAADRLEAYGVDPSQTRMQAMDLGSRVAEAAAQSSAGNQARTQTENIGRALRSEAINIGKGYPGQISSWMQGAGQSGNQATNTGLATTASGANTMGTGQNWQQLGNQGIGMWGNILNTGFSNQMDSWKANQQSQSGWGQLLGSVAGAAFGMFEEGGAIPVPGAANGMAIPDSASPSGGAAIDDVPAQIEGQMPAQLNAGEFVIPEDVVSWLGEKGMQQIIIKARKEMGNPDQAPAQPEVQNVPGRGVGAIPEG